MKLYHGTTRENLKKIKKSGILGLKDKKLYLSLERKYAKMHGEVVLEVHYNPKATEMKIEHLIDGTPIIQVVTKHKIKLL